MNELMIQFAILWGVYMSESILINGRDFSEDMKAYSSEELLPVFEEWTEEYGYSTIDDTVDFFEEKLVEALYGGE